LPPIGASSFWDTNNERNSDAVMTNDNSDGSSSTTKINEGGIILLAIILA
jgi:hypothetical protein